MSNKVALVTGGARGIGLGISKQLAKEGWDVVCCGTRQKADCQDALNQILDAAKQAGKDIRLEYYTCDVSDTSARAAMLENIRSDFGKLNALVNNAGVGAKVRADVLEMAEENFEWLMKINLQGPFFLTQAVLRWMLEEKKADPDFPAAVINVSSISATVASISRGEYCISKAGVSMATQLWAARVAPEGIGVYEIRPGIIHSDMTAVVTQKYDKLIAEGLTLQPRWGEPEDVGKAAAMLLRGDIAYSPGQVIMVDGGMSVIRL